MAGAATGAPLPTCDNYDAILAIQHFELERPVAACPRELLDWLAVTVDLPTLKQTILMKH